MDDKKFIYDSQAEAGVVATLLKHPDYLLSTDYMKPGYFYDVFNGCIYWAISELHLNGVDNIDALNITNILNSNNAVKKIMENYNIINFQEFIELSKYAARDSLEEYKLLVKNVMTAAFKRDVYKFALSLQELCQNDEKQLGELNRYISDEVTSIADKYLIGTESVLFGKKIRDIWRNICEKRNPDGTYGLESIIPSFNKYFEFAENTLILLKARMKRGKSAYFMNEAIHKIVNGAPVLYIDTEMDDEGFTKRLIANLASVDVRRVQNGDYTEEEAERIEKAIEFLEKAPLVHEYITDNYDDFAIEALCKKWKNKLGIKMVIYDYIKFDENASAAEISNALGHITNHLKNTIAGKLKLSVLVGAQLNRDDKVADSDKIERYITTSIMWDKKEPEEIRRDGKECGNYKATIDLNRNGGSMYECEYIDISFNGDKMQIKEAKKHKIETPFDKKKK